MSQIDDDFVIPYSYDAVSAVYQDESELTPLERFESLHKAEATEGSNRESAESPREGNLQSLTKSLFRKKTQKEIKFSAFDESAKKARPKLFFAGERTFLQWMHTGILLAGISMAIGSHAETGGVADWISVLLLPVAIGIMIYAMFQCKCILPDACITTDGVELTELYVFSMYPVSKRTYMIASRSPGPYEDRWGPVVVGVVFGCSLLAQFLVMLAHQS